MRTLKKLFLMSGIVGLVACGGGGGDSTGGGGTVSEFAGNYSGTLFLTVSDGRQTASDAVNYLIQITNQGQIIGNIPGLTSDAQCSSVPPTYLQGNTFYTSATYSCTASSLGTCNITASINGSIVGNVLSYKGNASFQCSIAGAFTATYTATLTKTG